MFCSHITKVNAGSRGEKPGPASSKAYRSLLGRLLSLPEQALVDPPFRYKRTTTLPAARFTFFMLLHPGRTEGVSSGVYHANAHSRTRNSCCLSDSIIGPLGASWHGDLHTCQPQTSCDQDIFSLCAKQSPKSSTQYHPGYRKPRRLYPQDCSFRLWAPGTLQSTNNPRRRSSDNSGRCATPATGFSLRYVQGH